MRNLIIPSDAPWSVAPFAVIDIEGNGAQPPDLVELGLVRVDSGVLGGLTTWLVRPEQRISPLVSRLHGIKNSDVEKAPLFDEIKTQVASALRGRYLVAHNAAIDWSVLHRKLPTFEPGGVIDTLRLAKSLYPERSSYKLSDLLLDFELNKTLDGIDGGPHRAGYDTMAAANLFIHLAQHSHRGPLLFGQVLNLGSLPQSSFELQQRLF